MGNKKVVIGLTYGDPAGIGPEILIKTLKNWNYKFKPLILGSKEIANKYKNLKNIKDIFIFVEPKSLPTGKIFLGKSSKISGLHSYICLKEAVSLACEKKIAALFTGPVSKKSISLSKSGFKGQTDEIAKLSGLKPNDVIMLFVSGDLRISLFTRHIPLKSVLSMLTKSELKRHCLLLNKELKKWFHLRNPKIAVLGLNPHAGEDGLIGKEEKSIILPVICELRFLGLDIHGPFSPDATLASAGKLYLSGKKQIFDAYVSIYHDQALPMFKSIAGMNGVNVTLGLPFVRVSVDHGTAFDIAGENIADNTSVVSALNLLKEIFISL